jgi:hypothetical protein
MKLYDFKFLDDKSQAEVLFNYGVLITERIYKDLVIQLYQINSFYVEVYYNSIFKMVQDINSFDNLTRLEPYLNSIDISFIHNFLQKEK